MFSTFDFIVPSTGREPLSPSSAMTFKFTAIAPKLNINGTSGIAMRDEYAKAHAAIEAAMDALADATLNGRDFQTMDDGANVFQAARDQRCAAMDHLWEAQLYVGEMLEQICDQL
jgi:hypothetical protein